MNCSDIVNAEQNWQLKDQIGKRKFGRPHKQWVDVVDCCRASVQQLSCSIRKIEHNRTK